MDELGEEQGHRRIGRAHSFVALQAVRIERIFCTQQRTSRPAHEDSVCEQCLCYGYGIEARQEGFLEARRHAHQHRLSECRFQVLQPGTDRLIRKEGCIDVSVGIACLDHLCDRQESCSPYRGTEKESVC